MATRRNARAEAAATLGSDWRPTLLEPSPPTDRTEPYLADDPVEAGPGTGTVVTPFGKPYDPDTVTWAEMVEQNPDLSFFAAERWLASWRRLEPLGDQFATTRLALHRVAAYLVSPARRRANTKIGLRFVKDGFGTPFFVGPDNEDVQVRVEGAELVHQRGDEVASTKLTTLAEAGELLGAEPDEAWAGEYDIPAAGDLHAPLAIDASSAAAIADWFGFAFSVLEELRADEASSGATRPQLWPEHFDPALEIGSDDDETRASYGLSPGDAGDGHPEPYLYVSAWYPEAMPANPFWSSETFPGAILHYGDLLEADDQREAALSFFRNGRALLLNR